LPGKNVDGAPGGRPLATMHQRSNWRRGSESNEVFTDCQPQYPDLQGDINADFTGLQAIFNTIRSLPDLTRHIPAAYSVIEEIVEGFVEGFSVWIYGTVVV
jgi:hypothetical protein